MRPIDFHSTERMLLKHVRRCRQAQASAKSPAQRAAFTFALFTLAEVLRELRTRWGKR